MEPGRAILAVTGVVVVVSVGVLFAVLTGGIGGEGGLLGGDDAPESVADLEDDDLPAGVSRDRGVTDGGALASAHNDTLAGTSYTMTVRFERSITRDGRTATVTLTQNAKVAGDGEMLVRFTREGTRATVTRTVWANDSAGVARLTRRGEHRFGEVDVADTRRNVSGHVLVEEMLAAGDFALAGVSRRDGRPALELVADTNASDGAEAIASVREFHSFSGRAVVTESGRVLEMHVEMEYVDRRGRRTAVTFDYDLEDVGSTTVERPDWVPEALSAAGGRLLPDSAPDAPPA